jgi:hypothetical protein
MRTRIQELPTPALAGSVMLLGGMALWQLGVEFERQWLRSYEGPLEGEAASGDAALARQALDPGGRAGAARGERRWVAPGHPRVAPRLRAS